MKGGYFAGVIYLVSNWSSEALIITRRHLCQERLGLLSIIRLIHYDNGVYHR